MVLTKTVLSNSCNTSILASLSIKFWVNLNSKLKSMRRNSLPTLEKRMSMLLQNGLMRTLNHWLLMLSRPIPLKNLVKLCKSKLLCWLSSTETTLKLSQLPTISSNLTAHQLQSLFVELQTKMTRNMIALIIGSTLAMKNLSLFTLTPKSSKNTSTPEICQLSMLNLWTTSLLTLKQAKLKHTRDNKNQTL